MRQVYTEVQRFRQWWLWAMLIFVAVLVFKESVWSSDGQKNLDAESIVSIALSLIPLLALVLFWYMRLETRIDATGIQYRFVPVHNKANTIPWEHIETVYVRRYKPLGEYGGWGIRSGTSKGGSAYNVSGNIGLQIVFKDGRKLLLGTRKPEDMEAVLLELGKHPGINIQAATEI